MCGTFRAPRVFSDLRKKTLKADEEHFENWFGKITTTAAEK